MRISYAHWAFVVTISSSVFWLGLPSITQAQTSTGGLFGGTRTVGAAAGTTAGRRTNLGIGQAMGGTSPQLGNQAGALTGNERFTRERAAGQFVGADTQDLASVLGAAVDARTQQLQLNNVDQTNTGVIAGGGTSRALRIRYTLGFRAPIIATSAIAARLAKSFAQETFLIDGEPAINARIDGARIVLKGQVVSAEARRLAVQIASLEPGVWEVEDQLELTRQEDIGPTKPLGDSETAAHADASSRLGGRPSPSLPGGLIPTFAKQ